MSSKFVNRIYIEHCLNCLYVTQDYIIKTTTGLPWWTRLKFGKSCYIKTSSALARNTWRKIFWQWTPNVPMFSCTLGMIGATSYCKNKSYLLWVTANVLKFSFTNHRGHSSLLFLELLPIILFIALLNLLVQFVLFHYFILHGLGHPRFIQFILRQLFVNNITRIIYFIV